MKIIKTGNSQVDRLINKYIRANVKREVKIKNIQKGRMKLEAERAKVTMLKELRNIHKDNKIDGSQVNIINTNLKNNIPNTIDTLNIKVTKRMVAGKAPTHRISNFEAVRLFRDVKNELGWKNHRDVKVSEFVNTNVFKNVVTSRSKNASFERIKHWLTTGEDDTTLSKEASRRTSFYTRSDMKKYNITKEEMVYMKRVNDMGYSPVVNSRIGMANRIRKIFASEISDEMKGMIYSPKTNSDFEYRTEQDFVNAGPEEAIRRLFDGSILAEDFDLAVLSNSTYIPGTL